LTHGVHDALGVGSGVGHCLFCLFAAGDVPVDLQDDACLASVAFPHGPPTRYHDATAILLGVCQRSFPPTTLGKFGFNLWQGTGKLGSQKCVSPFQEPPLWASHTSARLRGSRK